ncbi:MAG: redoxin domain-containing protein, partial [Sphingobacteriales bacterium]
MKKTLLILVLAALCLNFSNNAQAQTPANQAVDITSKGIQVGQKIPDIPILSKYKGKLVILDFWATWCSPCIAMWPKMTALQEQFKNDIQILPVTYQSDLEVTNFINKLDKQKRLELPHINGDNTLRNLFPHVYLPHYVWIDQQGVVKAITGPEELTEANIKNNLNQSSLNTALPRKTDLKIKFDESRPFLIDGNGGDGQNIIYHSLFTGYVEGLTSRITVSTSADKGRRIMFSNVSIKGLMQRAYSTYDNWFGNNRIIMEVKDSTAIRSGMRGSAVTDWLRKNGYCYELILPPHLAMMAGTI